MGKRRRNGNSRSYGGSRTYWKANTENVSIIRLYADDLNNTEISNINTFAGIKAALGITKAVSIKLIAVAFVASNLGGASGTQTTELEFQYSRSSFCLPHGALKPTRIRVPEKDYYAGQWANFEANSDVPLVGIGNGTTRLFRLEGLTPGTTTGSSTLYFIDVAVHY